MRDNKLILWLVLAVLLIVVLNLPSSVTQSAKYAVREGLAPLQSAVTGLWNSLGEGMSAVRGFGGMVNENQRMAAELTRLRNEVGNLKILERDNEQLRQQLGFSARGSRELVPCEVIARNRDGWWQTVRLGKGTADGIVSDLAVVSLDGLVGKTIEVSPHTSDVLLLSDASCKVAAQILRTGTFGIVAGRGPSWKGQVVCRMEFINKNTPIVPGDVVVTSGLGGIFPRGLLIGYVDKVFTDRSGLYQYADVISKADLGVLQYVFAVRGEPAGSLDDATGSRSASSEVAP